MVSGTEDRVNMYAVFYFFYILRLLKLRHCFSPIHCFIDMGSYSTVEVHLVTEVIRIKEMRVTSNEKGMQLSKVRTRP